MSHAVLPDRHEPLQRFRNMTLVVHKHIVYLCRRNAVATGTVDPNGNVTAAGFKLLAEQLRRDIIVKPTFLCDRAVEVQNSHGRSRLGLGVIRPIPKLLHRVFPPFRHRWWLYLQKHPHHALGAYCR